MGIMCHAFHEFAEKSSKIVPLGAPLLFSRFIFNNFRRYPLIRFELRDPTLRS